MNQREFLARCKRLHESFQDVPNGFLRAILKKAGCPPDSVQELRLIKLLQVLTNIVQQIDQDHSSISSLTSNDERENWNIRNESIAPLFLTNDLRIADAHESSENCQETLQKMGFDIAQIDEGYGYALDFVMDSAIQAFDAINSAAEKILERQD